MSQHSRILIYIDTPGDQDRAMALIRRRSALAKASGEEPLFLFRNAQTHQEICKWLGRTEVQEIVIYRSECRQTEAHTIRDAITLAAGCGYHTVEYWSETPGVFTANPREAPDARLIMRLHYSEAMEAAALGVIPLEAHLIEQLESQDIELKMRGYDCDGLQGTSIGSFADEDAHIKLITERGGLTVISVSSLGMVGTVGFMAQIFTAFERHGVGVDLVSTSETTVTVSIDSRRSFPNQDALGALVSELEASCAVKVRHDCVSITLVGQRVRASLGRIAPALGVFDSERVFLVTQASSDLNFSVVVAPGRARRLARRFHQLLFGSSGEADRIGPLWREVEAGTDLEEPKENKWWHKERSSLIALAREASPRYVYHGPTLDAAAVRLGELQNIDRVFFAIKANDNPLILRRFEAHGLGFECVSIGEVEHVLSACPGLNPQRILFTPNFAPQDDYEKAFSLGVRVTVDALFPLENWGAVFRDQKIMLRIDPGRGLGHHAHVRTGGTQSKFGIALDAVERVRKAVDEIGATVVGLHAHAGSGVRRAEAWSETADVLVFAARHFPSVEILDLGGGLGVVEKSTHSPLDLAALDKSLEGIRKRFPQYRLWLEPGRYLTAEAGILLTTVTQTKSKSNQVYVGVDAGMNVLIRPALYGAWHNIVNLTSLEQKPVLRAHVVGPICETGDTLGYDRSLPLTNAGDILLVDTAGAYGRTMSSGYNRRPMVNEYLFNP